MIGIPRGCRDPDESWKLIEFLYLSDMGLDARRNEGDTVSPLMERWNDPIVQQPDPFFGGQQVRALYVNLARQIPPRNVTPITNVAQITLSIVLGNAVEYVRDRGVVGLEDACRALAESGGGGRGAADQSRQLRSTGCSMSGIAGNGSSPEARRFRLWNLHAPGRAVSLPSSLSDPLFRICPVPAGK